MRKITLGTTLLALAAMHSSQVAAAPVTPPSDLASWDCTGNCGSSTQQGDVTLSPLGNAKYGYVSTADSFENGVSPLSLGNNHLGGETNGSKILSSSFSAGSNDTLNIQFNYVSTDGNGYDDYAWARLVNADQGNSTVAWLFAARSTNSGPKNIIPGDVLDKSDFDPDQRLTNYDTWDFTAKTVDWAPLGSSNNSCWEDDAKGCGYTGWLESSFTFTAAGNYRVEIGVTNWADNAYDSGLAFDFQTLTDSRIGSPSPVPEPETYAMMLAGLAVMSLATRRRKFARG